MHYTIGFGMRNKRDVAAEKATATEALALVDDLSKKR
jgi:hypothetical protein